MKRDILRLLKDASLAGEYISGQQLCEQFQVSRTAVWKAIEQLKKEGYEVEAVRNRGYRLVESPDLVTAVEVESFMKTDWAGRHVVHYEETDSTNTRAKDCARDKCPHGTIVIADSQTAGKGRRGRMWESPTGASIYMTLLLYPDMMPSYAPRVTPLMALAVAEGIKNATGLDTEIKWPNDVIVNGKKVCGILTEMSAEMDYINYVIIGAGINVNQDTFPEELSEKATSLKNELGHAVKRAPLIAEVMKSFEGYYETFMETKDLSRVKERYDELLVNRGREVCVLDPAGEYKAHALGINDTGELLVRLDTGEIKEVFAGEVSVRGVYGYV